VPEWLHVDGRRPHRQNTLVTGQPATKAIVDCCVANLALLTPNPSSMPAALAGGG
jgi:hypothetical protein